MDDEIFQQLANGIEKVRNKLYVNTCLGRILFELLEGDNNYVKGCDIDTLAELIKDNLETLRDDAYELAKLCGNG